MWVKWNSSIPGPLSALTLELRPGPGAGLWSEGMCFMSLSLKTELDMTYLQLNFQEICPFTQPFTKKPLILKIIFNWRNTALQYRVGFCSVSHVRLSATLWTVACQAPQSMRFSWKEDRSEWAAVPSSRGSSRPRDQTQVSALQADSLPPSHRGSPGFCQTSA